MSKQAKKRPKPVPCERWAVYNRSMEPIMVFGDRGTARNCAWEEDSVHRVRIVPVVAKAKRRKGAK